MLDNSRKEIELEDNQVVTVRIGAEVFGLPIATVEGIIGWEPLTHLPKMPVFLSGLISVRGSILPVMDLRTRLGMEATPPTSSHRILMLNIESVRFGAIVDEVCSVERLSEATIERSIPLAVSLADDYFAGVVNRESGMVILLKPEGLLTHSEREHLDKLTLPAADPTGHKETKDKLPTASPALAA